MDQIDNINTKKNADIINIKSKTILTLNNQ